MGIAERALAVRPEEGLPDPGVQVIGAAHPLVGRHAVLVLVVTAAQFQTSFFGPVTPGEGSVDVSVVEGRIPAEGEAVRRVIGESAEGVVVVEAVGNAQVRIREAGAAARIGALFRKMFEYPVGIGGARTRDDGGFSLMQRTFHMEAAGQEADARRSAPALHVPVLAGYVQDRGDTSAVLGRNGTLVQFDAVHDVRIEGGEDAEQVRRVVDGVPVEEDEVLVGAAAADVESAGSLAHALDAREGQDRLDDVSFPEGRRDLADRLHAHLFHAHLRVPVLGHALGRDDGFLEHRHLVGHHDIQAAVGMNLDAEGEVLFAFGAEIQDVLAAGNADAVLAFPVAAGVSLGGVVKDDHPVQRIAGFGFRNGAADGLQGRPLVHGGVADGINLVPVGGEKGAFHILDDGRILFLLGEIPVRQAVSGAGKVRLGDLSSGGRVAMGVPGNGFVVQGRGPGGRLEPFVEVAPVDFFQRPVFQNVERFHQEEVVRNIRVERGILVSDEQQAAVVSVEAEKLLHPPEQGSLPVPEDLEESLLRVRITQVAEVDELLAVHREPGHLVAEHDHGAGLFQGLDLQLLLDRIDIHQDVLVQLSVVQDIAPFEFLAVPVIRPVEFERIETRQLSAEDSGVGALGLLGGAADSQCQQGNQQQKGLSYHRKLLKG